ncbi:MAG: hypothetical protein EBX97_07255 [Actinobacteria bacterium]|nr:hypothetical protein [Actinomycetota bacterium]
MSNPQHSYEKSNSNYVKRVTASAPGRVNLIGEHIDYNDGWVLPFAIGERTSVTISLRDDSKFRFTSAQKKDVLEVDLSKLSPSKRRSDWSDYIAGTIWALEVDQGVDIQIDGQVRFRTRELILRVLLSALKMNM